VRDSLVFAKQQHQELRYKQNDAPSKQATTATASKQDPQSRYLRDTLAFSKQQHNELRHKQNEHERWQRHYGSLHVDELKKLSGTEFEDYLAVLFKSHGYQVETTPLTGDYGADLILNKDRQRIAVQAKCYTGSVGVSAVQEALSGMAYYQCHSAGVVTTGNYTANAVELARQSRVRLLSRNELGQLIVQMQNPTAN
jgi:HJR/Mrr/RecB family endonuclease